MKYKYLVFTYNDYYPSGGMNDFRFGFNTVEELDAESHDRLDTDECQVLNTETMEFETFNELVPEDDEGDIRIKANVDAIREYVIKCESAKNIRRD